MVEVRVGGDGRVQVLGVEEHRKEWGAASSGGFDSADDGVQP
jgi:hypothetical protein